MNTQIKIPHKFPAVLQSDIVEIITKIDDPTLDFVDYTDAPLVRRSALTGYEEAMRRHASACEAGR